MDEIRPYFTVRRVRLRWLVERHDAIGRGEFETMPIAKYWLESSAGLLCTALNMLAQHEHWRAFIPTPEAGG